VCCAPHKAARRKLTGFRVEIKCIRVGFLVKSLGGKFATLNINHAQHEYWTSCEFNVLGKS